jgi:hypothetical protein
VNWQIIVHMYILGQQKNLSSQLCVLGWGKHSQHRRTLLFIKLKIFRIILIHIRNNMKSIIDEYNKIKNIIKLNVFFYKSITSEKWQKKTRWIWSYTLSFNLIQIQSLNGWHIEVFPVKWTLRWLVFSLT